MLIHPSLERLSALRLVGMRQAFEEQLQLPEINTLSFEERFGLLIDREWTLRENRRLTARLKKATLRHRAAAVEDVDYRHPRGLDKSLLTRFATSQWVRLVSAKPNRTTTPINYDASSTLTTTVTDPRHPLFGQSFPVNGMINRPDYGPCVVVWAPHGLERHIPLTATDLSSQVLILSPLPLSITALNQLLSVHARLTQHLEEHAPHGDHTTAVSQFADPDETAQPALRDSGDSPAHSPAGSLGDLESTATGTAPSTARQYLLPPHQPKPTGGAG
jgi:hypothetical protein